MKVIEIGPLMGSKIYMCICNIEAIEAKTSGSTSLLNRKRLNQVAQPACNTPTNQSSGSTSLLNPKRLSQVAQPDWRNQPCGNIG